jgi:hypothetical protein
VLSAGGTALPGPPGRLATVFPLVGCLVLGLLAPAVLVLACHGLMSLTTD